MARMPSQQVVAEARVISELKAVRAASGFFHPIARSVFRPKEQAVYSPLRGGSFGFAGGRPGTWVGLNMSRAGLLVSATCAVVAAVEIAEVPQTSADRRTKAVTIAESVNEMGGHTAVFLYPLPARKVSIVSPFLRACRARGVIQNPPQIISSPAG